MISVVIPLYNKAHTIERTLSSVLNQTFQKFEVVLVNDGSTDNGVEVVAKFTNDPRVKIVEQSNQGVSVARNSGVANAKYDYISFLDGDDEWLPDYLKYVNEMILSYPNAGMYCMAGIVRSHGYDHFRIADKYKGKILTISYFTAPFVFSHTSSTTVSKQYFNMTNGFPPGVRNFQDFYLFTAMALISQVIYCGVPQSVYVGEVQGQATSAVNFSSKLGYRARYLNEFTEVYLQNKNRKLIAWLRAFSRNEIWFMMKSSNYENINFYISKMESVTQKKCLGVGRWLYPKKGLRIVALLYISVQKTLFLLRGYPRLNLNKGKIKTLEK